MKKLICDMDLAREHELLGTDILVFSALCYLCYRGDWELNYIALAETARCGSRMTAKRCCDILLQKKLITINENRVQITGAQNVQSSAQNVQSSAQNVQFCEKESTKEKENNKENKLVSINKGNQPTQDLKKEEFIIPSQSQVMEYAQQHNIPAMVAQKWYLYWEQHSWTQTNGQPVGKWQPCLEGFALRETPPPLRGEVGKGLPSPTFRSDPVAFRFRSDSVAFRGDSSPSQRERNEEIHRQIKAAERAQREADWAERENNRAAAAAFFARHPDWLKKE